MAVHRTPGALRPAPFAWVERGHDAASFDARQGAQGRRAAPRSASLGAPAADAAALTGATARAAQPAAATPGPGAAQRSRDLLGPFRPRTPLHVRRLYKGDRDDDVPSIRALLVRHQIGAPTLTPDADATRFDEATAAAVSRFQHQQHMVVTGHLDPLTHLRLLTALPFGGARVAAQTRAPGSVAVLDETDVAGWMLDGRLGAVYDGLLETQVGAALSSYVTRARFIEETGSWTAVHAFRHGHGRPLHVRVTKVARASADPGRLAQLILDALDLAARTSRREALAAAVAQLAEVVTALGVPGFAKLIDARIETGRARIPDEEARTKAGPDKQQAGAGPAEEFDDEEDEVCEICLAKASESGEPFVSAA